MPTDHTALDALIASLGIVYSANFVPFSQSRNAKKDAKLSDLSLNWRVTLSGGFGAPLVTDYQQGIGHLPKPLADAARGRITIDVDKAVRHACEKGKYFPGRSGVPNSDFAYEFGTSMREIPAPELRDVLYCLVSDASVIDYPEFEDWARDFGYDADSRKAEVMYRACLANALKLRALVRDENLAKLREAYQDY